MTFHFIPMGLAAVALTSTVAMSVGETAPEAQPARAVVAVESQPSALGEAKRYVLRNRLLDTSCVIARTAETVEPLGACKDTFAQAHRIERLRERDGRITFVDALGSAVLDFAWNPETGMSSVPSPMHPEAGALALLPVATKG